MSGTPPQTIVQKILARAAGRPESAVGEIVSARVDVALSHENAALVIRNFREIGVREVWDPERIVILFDHRVPAESEKTAAGHKLVREFVAAQGIEHFYDMRGGICHQVLVEQGHVRPGEVIVGTDSHTTTHGAFGAFATGIGATEMAGVWATGEIWLRVPETLRIDVTGSFPRWVGAKDLILKIIGAVGADGADYQSVEFYGPTIDDLSIAGRMVLANMAMEMGAKCALVPPDARTDEYLRARTGRPYTPVHADPDAVYAGHRAFDVTDLVPQVACPHAVDNVRPITEVLGTKLDQVLLGSCTNGRIEDLTIAALILRNRKVHPGVRLLVIPASWQVYQEAVRAGLVEIFIAAGGLVLNPGCGPCLGAHQGLLAAGERCLATTNRNFQGRMGSAQAEVYLASPAVAAASAIAGEIADPRVKGGVVPRSRSGPDAPTEPQTRRPS